MKKTPFRRRNYFKGVSTLDAIGKNLRIILLLLITTSMSTFVYGGHSILDLVDPSFNPQITTTSFGFKTVGAIEALPDGKILVAGNFNSYNRQPVGGLVRLNPNGSLDTTFNNNVVPPNEAQGILVQSDGKILLYGHGILMRLNSDGTRDSSFTPGNLALRILDAAIDAGGRIILGGRFANNPNDSATGIRVIRLNPDGSTDSSFNYVSTDPSVGTTVAVQNNKVIVDHLGLGYVIRLNENGSADTTFVTDSTFSSFFSSKKKVIVLPDNKILSLTEKRLVRFNENGSVDSSFQRIDFPYEGLTDSTMRVGIDGKITVVGGAFGQQKVRRFLPNGQVDQSFTPYTHTRLPSGLKSFAVQSDGGVILGDEYIGGQPGASILNTFTRLLPNGTPDTSFNSGGIGFQTITSGGNQAYVRAIASQPNGKVLIGGKFDNVNGVYRPKIARLNPDSTVDTSFQTNATPEGNYFSLMREVYNIRVQNDGKIIVSGNFQYVVNGATKENLVRLNSDGSIDSTFNLGVAVHDNFGPNNAGTNKVALFNDGKLLVGTSRLSSIFNNLTPLKLTATGAVDASFNPTIHNTANWVHIHDVAIQPDGKILIGGIYVPISLITDPDVTKSFIARLNPDGSVDQTFQAAEDTNKLVSTFALLPGGKILVVKRDLTTMSQVSTVQRLNSNGSFDSSFNAGTGANGRINAIVTLPSGDIFVGGAFTKFNEQPRQNLARLNPDGKLDPMSYNVNEEVLGLDVDREGRLLVGGKFTVIGTNGENSNRSYMARIIDSAQVSRNTRFDFDGDGKADLGVFDNTNGDWSIRNSQANQVSNSQFGQAGDKMAAADFDGDGKTDRAVYRPSTGVWHLMQSTAGSTTIRWGASEDRPVPADYDGDGKADAAVWRPSTRFWYILQSSNNQMKAVHWGLTSDILLPNADYDGDGRADIAVFRPSNGTFYWLASSANDQFRSMQFGQSGDIPAIGDFNADGKSDFAVFRPSDGAWYQYLTTSNGGYTFFGIKWGQNGDEPVAADYDGDGRTDVAVRRQGTWYLLMSEQGFAGGGFGSSNAQAIAALPNQ
jgi:uncharacterized delta-60 repeat protein